MHCKDRTHDHSVIRRQGRIEAEADIGTCATGTVGSVNLHGISGTREQPHPSQTSPIPGMFNLDGSLLGFA